MTYDPDLYGPPERGGPPDPFAELFSDAAREQDEWAAEDEELSQPGSILPQQRSLIMLHLGNLTENLRAGVLRDLAADQSIESTDDLSAHQAGVVIAKLEAKRDA
jgi:hypothetical protein